MILDTKKLTTNKKIFLFVIASIGGFLIYLWFVFYGVNSLFGRIANKIIKQGVFSEIDPQKTTTGELESKFGKPAGKETVDNTETYFYNSSEKYKYEYAWVQNGKVIATKETVPQNATESEFRKNLGTPNMTLYDVSILHATWLIFLDKGIAIRTWENRVYVLVRFAPQSSELFLKNIAPVLGITTEKLKEEVEEPGI